MLSFWGVVALLLATTIALIVPGLLRPRQMDTREGPAEKAKIYRQHFDELLHDKNSGLLAAGQFQLATSELEHRILEEADGISKSHGYNRDPITALALLVAIPVLAILFYLKIGSPNTITDPLAQSAAAVEQSNIESILQNLQLKLQKDPGDGAGWELLGKAYSKLHRYDEASLAYENAVKAIPDNAQLLTDYAIALAFTNNRKLEGKPELLINQALAIDANYPKAMMLAASAAFDRKDYQVAIDFWQRLEQRLPPDSDAARSISRALQTARSKLEQK